MSLTSFAKALVPLPVVSAVVLCLSCLSFSLSAAIIDHTWIGTWGGTGAGNPVGVNGPGMSAGQRFVIRVAYDDASAVTDNVDVLDAFFNPSGELMRTIDLNAAGNSLDIFVPMEGLDAGSPFIYVQSEADHFPAFIPNPTLNFVNGSNISNTANLIGLEFEGNFFAGAAQNVIELFNTAPPGGPINMQSQIFNLDNGLPAVTGSNSLASAVGLAIDAGPDLVYNAATLVQNTSMSVLQSNDLGAARSDGEDFVDVSWTPAGTPSGNDTSVGIADSGLTMTTSTTTWTANATEQMTGKTASDTLNISYDNAVPTLNASATANAGGTDFSMTFADLDLAVNALIAGFESLTFAALLDGLIDATAFFNTLFTTGSQSSSDASLFSAFGAGAHNVVFTLVDKAGAMARASVDFTVNTVPQDVPEPGTWLLILLGASLLMLRPTAGKRSRRC
ncbi:PEP-CTERM sorting domain-containing protein [Aliiglaciecola sp. CAU 1673]|uniref:PEP-CTERM sorting domain-containing protein n=1 Tax=Aliiglaciecola sp. CAU 1673 TaxID=3032595 RepID=UPI0023DA3C62|nr:PEP-CTERM sorting domain-containing protein [Aliiglaciecola sp. CAU 1673]MDF2178070.1 PEP-CTERM sorting domain-containing protein [Aliiglaciecola sp. CAU 1673]